jgi:hypothetical protein
MCVCVERESFFHVAPCEVFHFPLTTTFWFAFLRNLKLQPHHRHAAKKTERERERESKSGEENILGRKGESERIFFLNLDFLLSDYCQQT